MAEKDRVYVAVGRFGKTRGVAGELYIQLLTDNPGRFESNVQFWVDDGKNGYREIEFDSVKEISGRTVVKVRGIDSPETAKKELTNLFIYVDKAALGKAPEGRYYHFDLVGCRVEDEHKRIYGRVTEVAEYPANDVLVVESEEKKIYYLPLVRQFIKKIDIDDKLIVADPAGGIFGETDEV